MLYYFEGVKLNNGKQTFGFIDVSNKEELIWHFRRKRILVKKIGSTKQDFRKRNFIKIKHWEKVAFLKLLNSLIKNCDFSVSEALKALINRFSSKPFNKKLRIFLRKTKEGKSFSRILKEENFLKSFYIKIIEAGEKTQRLEDYLHIVIDQYQAQYNLDKKIKAKILIPLLLLFGLVVLDIYWWTLLDYNVWNFFIIPLIILSLASILLFVAVKITPLRYLIDKLILKTPFIKNLASDYFELKSIIFLISSFRCGLYIPIVFFELATETNNVVYRKKFLEISDNLKQGNSLNKSLASGALFSNFFVNSITFGEQIGLNNKMILDIRDYLIVKLNKRIVFFHHFLKIGLIFLIILFLILLGTKIFQFDYLNYLV